MTADTPTTETSLGELIVALYEEFLALYGDEDVASVAVAATLNDWIVETVAPQDSAEAA